MAASPSLTKPLSLAKVGYLALLGKTFLSEKQVIGFSVIPNIIIED